jgi:hypothetical protein
MPSANLPLGNTGVSPGIRGEDPWHSSASVHSEVMHDIQRHTRELRTTDEKPTAPRLELLFRHGNVPPEQFVVVWDPARNWPGFAIHALAALGTGELTEVRMRQEGQAEPLLILEYTLFKPEPGSVGVMQLHAAPDDPVAVRLALSLLSQASRAIVLAGSALDAEWVHHVRTQLPDHQWSGPPLLLVSPSDKPSRAQRLKRLSWPAGLHIDVIELHKSNAAGWSSQLIEQGIAMDTDARSEDRQEIPLNRSKKQAHLSASVAPQNPAVPTPSHLPRSAVPADAVSASALALVAAAPGVCACALIDSRDGTVWAQHGQTDLVQSSAAAASCLWSAYGNTASDSTLNELSWNAGSHLNLVLPVSAHPGLLLMAVVDREFGDPAQSRWHLAVARNHFG